MKPNIFFTADPHYGHANIIRLCNRPFSSIEEMDEKLIENHNEVISPKDFVYILGDFSYKGNSKAIDYFKRLNGIKILIKGNHDKSKTINLPWKSVHDVLHLSLKTIPGFHKDDREIFLSHYSHRSWNKSFHGVPHLFGHCHGKLPPYGASFDIGVDCWDYKPVDIEQVFDHVEKLKKNMAEKVI